MRKNSKLSVEDRIVHVQTRLYSNLRQCRPRDAVRARGTRKAEPRRVMTTALLAGLWPGGYKEAVQRSAIMNTVDVGGTNTKRTNKKE